VFAHNGDLLEFHPELNGRFLPVGGTDSERAFCLILETIHAAFRSKPASEVLYQLICKISGEIGHFGTFNFLLSNGEYLFAHCSSDLHYLIRKHPFSSAQLKDLDMTIDFQQVTTQDDRVAVIATQPLTVNEEWIKMKPGECLLFQDGSLLVA